MWDFTNPNVLDAHQPGRSAIRRLVFLAFGFILCSFYFRWNLTDSACLTVSPELVFCDRILVSIVFLGLVFYNVLIHTVVGLHVVLTAIYATSSVSTLVLKFW